MCQRPALRPVRTSSGRAEFAHFSDLAAPPPSREELFSDAATLKIRTMKRVRFQPPTLLNSFADPTYSLNEESKHSMWWTRDELTPPLGITLRSQNSMNSLNPSVSICLLMFMISNLSIL